MARQTTPFEDQVTPKRVGERTYRVEVSDQWNAPIYPHGGVTTSIAVEAMRAELELSVKGKLLRSVHTTFCAPVDHGEVEIVVAHLRVGRSVSQLSAQLFNCSTGHLALNVVAIFGVDRAGYVFTDVEPPEINDPNEAHSWRNPPPEDFQTRWRSTFWDYHAEGRSNSGHAPWDFWDPTTSESSHWARLDPAPVNERGEWHDGALITLADTMTGSVREMVGPIDGAIMAPSLDLYVQILGSAVGEWLLLQTRARHAANGYAQLENFLYDDGKRLVGYATQVAMLSFPDGQPIARGKTSERVSWFAG